MYAGAMGIANDLSTLLKAANRLRDNVGIQFVIVGDGKERANLHAEAQALQLPKCAVCGLAAEVADAGSISSGRCMCGDLTEYPDVSNDLSQ